VLQETLETCVGTKAAASFLRQAHGNGSTRIVTDRQRKSISKETTFGTDVDGEAVLHDTLLGLATEVARTARSENLAGTVITIKVRYGGFDTYTRQTTLPNPTNDERLILETAWALFKNNGLPSERVRLIGVGISDWATPAASQADLFATPGHGTTDQNILDAIDTVTEKYGKPILKVGVARKGG
jgi:DNA polymerase-4